MKDDATNCRDRTTFGKIDCDIHSSRREESESRRIDFRKRQSLAFDAQSFWLTANSYLVVSNIAGVREASILGLRACRLTRQKPNLSKGGVLTPPANALALVHPVFDQVIDNRWIRKRRCIAQRTKIIFGNFAQDPAHDFTRSGFWQAWGPLDKIRFCDWSDF